MNPTQVWDAIRRVNRLSNYQHVNDEENTSPIFMTDMFYEPQRRGRGGAFNRKMVLYQNWYNIAMLFQHNLFVTADII